MRAVLRLYPAAWRERYGDEMELILEDRPPDLHATLDLLRGALDARMHPSMTPATAGGPPVPVSSDRSRAARFPFGPFLATLAAGLFLTTAAIVAMPGPLPELVWVELAGVFLAMASFVLGLAVLATTRRGIVAGMAGLVLIAGIIFVTWAGSWLPALMSICAGSALLLVGSIIERRPARWVGALAAVLAVAFGLAYRQEAMQLIALPIGGYAIVAAGLALAAGGSRRPVAAGLVAFGLLASLIMSVTLTSSPIKVHDGYGVDCQGLDEATCIARVDAVAGRVLALRPGDRVVSASASEWGEVQVCTEPPPAINAQTKDGQWPADFGPEAGNGVHSATGTVRDGSMLVCWRPDDPSALQPLA